MTGVTAMMAGDGAPASPVAPLTVSAALNKGDVYYVSGASGDLYTAANSVIVYISSGGVPPYSATGPGGVDPYLADNPSGKAAIVAAPGDPGSHNTIGWSGLALNEVVSFSINASIADTAGNSATSRYPTNPARLVGIQRTA